jgi:hypothetical protein
MKSLTGKKRKPILNKKGEMLMEAIVSVLLLSILLVIITTMIQTSRNMTARSMDDARLLQQYQLNPVSLAAFDDFNTTPGSIRFHFADILKDIEIDSEHGISIFNPNSFDPPVNIVAFFPD